MKIKFLAFLMALLMIVSCLVGCGSKKKNNEPISNEPVSGAEDNSIFAGDDWVDNEKAPGESGEGGHQKADSIPASATLIGTEFLPPIGNQGSIGSCASSSIAYCQFSNAVARYLHSLDPDSEFLPSTGKSEYLISSKFTMNFSGAGTAWVYDVLRDHGALTRVDADFYRNANGAASAGSKNNPYLESSSWSVDEGELTKALNMRLDNYEQIWMNGYNYQFTTTEQGQALIEKIKDAVVTGNVVVTGGFSSYWEYGYIDDDGLGALGKEGDSAIIYSAEYGSPGGHQVSIVGYDDNITATVGGVKMKGAFQVANSWGDYWQNDGYVWLMYDAVNKVSEYAELQNDDIYSNKRYLSFGTDAAAVGRYLHLGSNATDLTFVQKGSAKIEGKNYQTFFITCNGSFLTYNGSNTAVDKTVTADNGLWALIPIADISGMQGYSAGKYSDTLKGGYVLYAVNASGNNFLYGGGSGGSSNTKPSLTSLTGTYTYSNICFALEGFDSSKNQQTIRVLCHNGAGESTPRTFSMDQFCFVYWDCDIVCDDPGYTVTAEVIAKNRESFYLELTRTDASGDTVTYVPAMFNYGENFANVHPKSEYCSDDNYLNFKGEVNGDSCTGYITLSYAPLLPEGASYDNYVWGVNIVSASSAVSIEKITLKDNNGKILSALTPENNKNATGKYVFDFGYELESYHNVGTYHLQNADGSFLVSDSVMLFVPGEAQNATRFDIEYNYATNEYIFRLGHKDYYLLDIHGKDIEPGVMVKFNTESVRRNTQTWRVIENTDGTVNIRLACDTRYAMGLKDGTVCLVTGSDIKTYGTWTLHPGGANTNTFDVTETENGLSVTCTTPKEVTGNITVSVADANGNILKTVTPAFDANGNASFTIDGLSNGSYVISLLVDGVPSQDVNRCVYILQ